MPYGFPDCQLRRFLLHRGVGEPGVLRDVVEINLNINIKYYVTSCHIMSLSGLGQALQSPLSSLKCSLTKNL